MTIGTRIIRAPHGDAISSTGWPPEAARSTCLDEATDNLDTAVAKIETWTREPDVLADQSSAHDALIGDVPHGMSLAETLVLRAQRPDEYIARAEIEITFDIPGFVPEYVRPLFCERAGPFRWAARPGDPEDIHVTDALALDMFSDDDALMRWCRMAHAAADSQDIQRPMRIH